MNYKNPLLYIFNTFFLSYNAQIVIYFLIYACGTLCVRGISFFILPIIMNAINPAEYGILSLTTSFLTITTAIIGFGLRQMLSIEYFHANHIDRCHLIQQILTLYTLIALPLLVFIWNARLYFLSFFFFNTLTPASFAALLISIFLFFYIELMYQILQYQQAVKQLFSIQIFVALGLASSSLYSVWYCNLGVSGIVWSQCLIAFCTSLCSIIYFGKNNFLPQSLHITFRKGMYYIQYGFPFIPSIIANWILASADRWVLGYYCGMYDVGIYATADLASQLFYCIILQSWASAYLPYIMKKYHENKSSFALIEQENLRTMWISMIGCIIFITCSYPFVQIIIPKLLPTSYSQALRYSMILLIGQIFLLGSYFASALIQYSKHTYFLAIALCVPASLNLVLNFMFVPLWGIMGCAFATLISYVIYFMITYTYNKRLIASYLQA